MPTGFTRFTYCMYCSKQLIEITYRGGGRGPDGPRRGGTSRGGAASLVAVALSGGRGRRRHLNNNKELSCKVQSNDQHWIGPLHGEDLDLKLICFGLSNICKYQRIDAC